MKRIISILILYAIIISSICLVSCDSYEGFKVVEIENYGTIKVPEDWEISVEDGYTFFYVESNGERKNVLVQYFNEDNTNEYFADVENTEWIWDENYSNSAGISRERVEYNDSSSEEAYIIYITGPEMGSFMNFICTDPSIDESVIKKVARSFEMLME